MRANLNTVLHHLNRDPGRDYLWLLWVWCICRESTCLSGFIIIWKIRILFSVTEFITLEKMSWKSRGLFLLLDSLRGKKAQVIKRAMREEEAFLIPFADHMFLSWEDSSTRLYMKRERLWEKNNLCKAAWIPLRISIWLCPKTKGIHSHTHCQTFCGITIHWRSHLFHHR